MAKLIITDEQRLALATVDQHMENAFAEGVATATTPVIDELPEYANLPTESKKAVRDAFTRALAAYLKAVGSGGGGGGGADDTNVMTATCQSTDVVGDLVIPIAGVGGARTVKKVDRLALASMPAIGVIVAKSSATAATVQVGGVISGIYSGLTPGRRYFVGASARPALDPAQGLGTGATYYIQAVGVAVDAQALMLAPSLDIVEHEAP